MQKAFNTILVLAAVFVLGTSAFSTGLKGDFDNDGDVDAKDLAVFSENFGKIDGACMDNDNCIPGYYCEKDIGDCNGAGVCTEKPSGCAEIYDPVCGCDGETYANLCFAAAAGVNVLHEGECPMPGQFKLDENFTLHYQEEKRNEEENIRIKFESVRHDSRCPIDVYCVWPGNAEVEFTFSKNNVARTILLNTTVEPTEVFLFGYRIKLLRLEPPVLLDNPPAQDNYVAYLLITKSSISCFDNSDCGAEAYCAKAPGDCTGNGKCTPRPTVCREDWNPVCGCDYVTYFNACSASRSGVNIAYEGRCRLGKCDDGSEWICDMMPPICKEFEILALQQGCWICVNPATCRPWGEPGCSDDKACSAGMWCDPCGTSSCPFCENCVPACVADSR